MKYSIRYLDSKGKTVSEIIDAENKNACENYVAGIQGTLVFAEAKTHLVQNTKTDTKKKIKITLLSEFTAVLASLLDSNLTLRDSLDVMVSIGEKKEIRALSLELLTAIEKGDSLHEAFKKTTFIYPQIVLGLIKVGERTGKLSSAINRLSVYLNDQKKLRDAVSGALVYPMIVFSVAIIGFFVVSLYALPKLSLVFSQLGGKAMQSLNESMANAQVIISIFLILVMLIVIAILGIIYYSKKDLSFKIKVDNSILKLPLIGEVLLGKEVLDFSFAMESMVQAGITLDDALLDSANASSNAAFTKALQDMRLKILKGSSLSLASAQVGVFPPYVIQWLHVGERTGATMQVFSQLRKYYEVYVERKLKFITSMIEPFFTILIGLGVVAVIFLFIIPIFTVYSNLM